MTLDQLIPLGEVPGVELVSLQKGEPASQATSELLGMTVHDFTNELDDFADTAALLTGLPCHQRRYVGRSPRGWPPQAGLASQPLRYGLAVVAEPGRQSVVPNSPPVSAAQSA